MKTAFNGIGHMSVSFTAGNVVAGQVCKMEDNGKVTPCADGDVFIGMAEGMRKDCAAVQLHGFTELEYTGTAPGLGYVNLVANGSGGVKVGSAGREYLVVAVDEKAMKIIAEL